MIHRLRLASGLVLFVFVLFHSVNHSLGLISLEAMEAGRHIFLWVWRGWAGTTVLLVAMVTHICLALTTIYRRRSLRLPPWHWAQMLLGLFIPPLLAIHVFGTRLSHEFFTTQDSYAYVLLVLWKLSPMDGIQQAVVLMVAWAHACFGLHFWLRIRPWYRRHIAWLYGLALLVPAAALAGFVAGGQAVARLAEDPAWLQGLAAAANPPDAAQVRTLYDAHNLALAVMAVLLLVPFVARGVRRLNERRRGLIRVRYPSGRSVQVAPGPILLDISWQFAIPHASVCGGRGRCSTCRVRVDDGQDNLSPPDSHEQAVLQRVFAPPGVRLACQARPRGDVAIAPLLPPTASPADAAPGSAARHGVERDVTVLFADLREFTRFSENRLPYDVVFVLNRYFRSMGEAIENAGGIVDKFIGDGIMALFGVTGDPALGARQAAAAACAMGAALATLNQDLADDLSQPLRMGIGLHHGPVIVGELGYGETISLTAIGDTVNTASRLESMTKSYGCELILSEDVSRAGGLDLTGHDTAEAEVRGRTRPLTVHLVGRAASLDL
ncbi:MAG: adenylate/guanylate cyclase domain-containing protein [Alphaproteobacteria bacterium]